MSWRTECEFQTVEFDAQLLCGKSILREKSICGKSILRDKSIDIEVVLTDTLDDSQVVNSVFFCRTPAFVLHEAVKSTALVSKIFTEHRAVSL